MERKLIQVYTKENCSYCDAAKRLLNQKGIPFNEIRIGVDVVREEVVNMFPNHKTVPIIVDDGGVIGGYQQLAEYVDNTQKETGDLLLG